MSEPESGCRWVDCEAVARILGVSGRSVRRWVQRGYVARWRRVGCGANRRYQVADTEIEPLRRTFLGDRSDLLDRSDAKH